MIKKFTILTIFAILLSTTFPLLQVDASSKGVTKAEKGIVRDAYYLNDADTKALIKSFEDGDGKNLTDAIAEIVGKGARGLGGPTAEWIIQWAVESKIKEIKKANKGNGVIIYYNRLYKSRSISVYSQ